ncbi:hypothetical protein L228DRAFT_249351 [Xylona heveae TC161]|uniref:F-box domain-containing protein n=1 Tax=Xylona heveae (strain CBS 132557 / TC161) TaxID=1328760 RepID=A0A165AJT6_XYLHT|nr:hypothetical protein L228DRAFT_249351 [Xylona heveae TC161]KZF20597.1 hypothetical protein L228DRAFT_249351 [Xylona heveae TC161]
MITIRSLYSTHGTLPGLSGVIAAAASVARPTSEGGQQSHEPGPLISGPQSIVELCIQITHQPCLHIYTITADPCTSNPELEPFSRLWKASSISHSAEAGLPVMAPIYSYAWSSSTSSSSTSSSTTTTTTTKRAVEPTPPFRFSYAASPSSSSKWQYFTAPSASSSQQAFPPSPLSSCPSPRSSAGQSNTRELEHDQEQLKQHHTIASASLITDPRFTLPTPPPLSRVSTPGPGSASAPPSSAVATSTATSDASSAASSSPLLRLPLELRNQIYSYLLPTTIMVPGYTKKHAWLRGHTAILATNRQLHEEAATEMYGNAMFELEVAWAGISFGYRWLLPSGLVPNRTYPFPEYISGRYTQRIRKFDITVHHVDSYTGMVKYNYGGMGLTDGLRDQVAKLCRVLAECEQLQELRVKLIDGNCRGAWGDHRGQTVLEPLRDLRGVPRVSIAGSTTPEYAKRLKDDMEHDAGRAPIQDYFSLPSSLSPSPSLQETPETTSTIGTPTGRAHSRPSHIFNDDLACDVFEM